ncbi:MAG TPA: hypothetical protein VFS05_06900, partial [Gemmatimonadaceae bacterium]|nr:hypothetical protein [Gemmatimonadaceae bacterium]
MQTIARAVALTLTAAALCAATPTHADAQLGRLKRKLEEKVGDKAADKAADKAQQGGPTATPRQLQFQGNLVEITEARLASLMKGLDAQREASPRIQREAAAADAQYASAAKEYEAKYARYEKEQSAYDKAWAKWNDCTTELNNRFGAEEDERNAAQAAKGRELEAEYDEAKQARMQELSKKMEAAQQRGDQKAMMAYRDTMMALLQPAMNAGMEGQKAVSEGQQRSKAHEAQLQAKCGTEPQRPTAPTPPKQASSIMAQLDTVAYRSSGLEGGQFDLMRERVVPWLRARAAGRRVSANYAYTAAELAALERMEKRLAPYVEQMENPAPWFAGR